MSVTPEEILDFWLNEIGPERWFSTDTSFDMRMRERFAAAHDFASAEKLPAWKETPEGMLALLLLLEQFPRRMYRGTPRAYATDDLAIELARDGIVKHFDDRIDKSYKLIFYLPFMNSESVGDQRLALFYIRERTKENNWLTIAERNLQIVDRFGRFPDRNQALGRETTPAEQQFLQQSASF